MHFTTTVFVLAVASFVSACDQAELSLVPELSMYVARLNQPFVINLSLSADRRIDLNIFEETHNTFMVGSWSHRDIEEKRMNMADRKGNLRTTSISPQRSSHYRLTAVLRKCKDMSRYCLHFGPGPLGYVPADIGETVDVFILIHDETGWFYDSDESIASADVEIRLSK